MIYLSRLARLYMIILSLAAWAWNGAMSRRWPKEYPRILLAKTLPEMVRLESI